MPKNPKSITQKDPFGCSIACLAFLLNISYLEASTLFEDLAVGAKNKGSTCKEVVEALAKKGISAKYKYLKPHWHRRIYRGRVIVFLKQSKKFPYGHYLIRINNIWMDPWINLNKTKDIKKAKSGFRKRLPSKPIFGIFIETSC